MHAADGATPPASLGAARAQEPAKPAADFPADLADFAQEGHYEKVLQGQVTGTDDGFEVDFTDEAGETAGHADIHFEIVEGEGPEDFQAYM